VRISSKKLGNAIKKAKVETPRLVEAVVAAGLSTRSAETAIRNWLDGRDHPRCKPAYVRAVAAACGVDAKDVATFTSTVKYHRGSPRKARLLADLIRGKTYDKARDLLSFTPKRAALNIQKALDSALAQAELAEADTTKLVVCESRVDEGPRIKRFQPKDRGRAHPIIKQMSHITISLEEKSGGKA
jgi:large subunit ribosomal protein L22